LIHKYKNRKHVAVLIDVINGTMADSSSDDSISTSTAALTTLITPKQALSNDSTLQQQPSQVHLQQPLPLTATLLDVQQLDDYLLRLVLAKLQQLVHTYYGSSEGANSATDTDTIASSTSSWLWPALQLVTLWVTQGQTPAVRLLGLRVDVDACGSGESSSAKRSNIRIGLLRYSVLGIIVPYLYQKLKDWKTSVEMEVQSQPQEESPDGSHPTHNQQVERQHVARQRRLLVARLLIRAVDTMLPGVKLFLLLTTWSSTGQQHVPNNIAARLCRWKYHSAVAQSRSMSQQQQPQNQQNRLHVDFAHRRWLYDCLMQTSRIWWAGLFLLPPVWGPGVQDYMVSPVTRLVRDISDRVAATAASATALVFSPKTVNTIGGARQQRQKCLLSCPICRRTDTDPVTVPVQGNCTDTCRQIYCYACLYAAAVRSRSSSSKVYCRTCREIITSCQFVDVQVDAIGD
jgi:hypothetical protein